MRTLEVTTGDCRIVVGTHGIKKIYNLRHSSLRTSFGSSRLQVTGGNNFQLIASNPKELCKICVRLLSKDVVRDSVRGSMTVNHLERTR